MKYNNNIPFFEDRIPLLMLSLTDKCNLNCTYCFKKEEMKARNELPYEDWINAYNMYKPMMIQLFGGEPTLRWNDILKFMDYIYEDVDYSKMSIDPHNHPTLIHFATNGTTGVDYNEIPEKYRRFISICFSLDGFAKTHDLTRGVGNYDKTHGAIKRCISAGIKTGINCTLPANIYINNLDSINDFIKYYYDLGLDFMRINTVFYPNKELHKGLTRTENTLKAISLLKQLENVKKYHVDIVDRSGFCDKIGIHVHANGDFSPKCTAIQVSFGHYSNWSLKDALKLNEFCINNKWDCNNISHKNLDRYVQGLIVKKTQKQEE